MSKFTKTEREEYAAFERQMYKNFDNYDYRDGMALWDIARSLHRLDENECNYGLTLRQETRERNLEKKATEIGKKYGIEITHNGDPRGYSLYLHLPDMSYNSWGGAETGWGIG